MKKILAVAAVSTLLFSACDSEFISASGDGQAAAAQAELTELADIGAHWAAPSIREAIKHGYIDGYEDRTFRPEAEVSRAEFVKMVLAAGKRDIDAAKPGAAWHEPYLAAAIKLGIVLDDDFSREGMDQPITRLELSRVAVRAADEALHHKSVRMDDKSVMYNATRQGLIQGLAGGELGLHRSTTRAQSVTVVERILALEQGQKLPVDKTAASYAEVELRGTNLQTMWNAAPVSLPLSIELGGHLQTTIDQVIVADMSDPDSAFYSWFRDAVKTGGRPLSDDYIVALHMNIANVEQQAHEYISVNRSLVFMNYSLATIADDAPSPVKNFPLIWLDRVGDYEGWYLSAIPKSYIQKDMDRAGHSELLLHRVNSSGYYYLTEETSFE